MNKTLTALLTAAAATLSLGAHADATLTPSQAADQKAEAKADYKADKKAAAADYDVKKADCKANNSGSAERACKKDAKAQAKLDKADAKVDYKRENADINANTK
jgi:hypothetical protein